jgi:hypothetical protein
MRLPFGGRGKSGWVIERQNGRLTKRDGALIFSREFARG